MWLSVFDELVFVNGGVTVISNGHIVTKSVNMVENELLMLYML